MWFHVEIKLLPLVTHAKTLLFHFRRGYMLK